MINYTSYNKTKKFLEIATVSCGIWKSVSNHNLNIKMITIYFISILLINIQLLTYICLEFNENVIEKSEGIQFFGHMFHDLMMYIFIIRNHKSATILIENIGKNFNEVEFKYHARVSLIRQKTEKIINIFIMVVFVIINFAFLSHTLAKIYNASPFLPVYNKLPEILSLSSNNTTAFYIFFFLLNIWQSILSIILNMSAITYTVSFILFLSAEFDILKILFENMIDQKYLTMNVIKSKEILFSNILTVSRKYQNDRYHEEQLKKLVKHHLYLLQ